MLNEITGYIVGVWAGFWLGYLIAHWRIEKRYLDQQWKLTNENMMLKTKMRVLYGHSDDRF